MDREALIRAVDALEGRAPGYLTRGDVESEVGRSVESEIAAGLLLVDDRTDVDGQSVTLCRLNRHHPDVQRLTAW
ncbi:MAG: hypothetical protein NVSMB2_18770 [Chloroflexota bacterium]